MAESPMVIYHAGAYYLIYHNTAHGEEYRIGLTRRLDHGQKLFLWIPVGPTKSGLGRMAWITPPTYKDILGVMRL